MEAQQQSVNMRLATRNFREALRASFIADASPVASPGPAVQYVIYDESIQEEDGEGEEDAEGQAARDGNDEAGLKLKMRDLLFAIRTDVSPAAAVKEATTIASPRAQAPFIHHHATTFNNDPVALVLPPCLTDSEKDDLLEGLLAENERLKGKINAVVEGAESSLASFAALQESISGNFAKQLAEKERRNASLYLENEKLREMVSTLRNALEVEKCEVGRACALIERLSRLKR